MRRGDTFLIKEAGLDTHLWIITSCPLRDPSRVLCLNVTTFDSRNPSKDPACILVRTDHPFLTKDESCIHYAGAKLLSLDDLIRWKQTKLIEMREPMSEEIMGRIYCGAETSCRMSLEHAEILEFQRFILNDDF